MYDYFVPDSTLPHLRGELRKQLNPAELSVVPPEDLPDEMVINQALQRGVFAYNKRPLWDYLAVSAFKFDLIAALLTYSLFYSSVQSCGLGASCSERADSRIVRLEHPCHTVLKQPVNEDRF